MCFGMFHINLHHVVLRPTAQSPAPWGCSTSTMMILLPNAQGPAPWGDGFIMCLGMFPFSLHHGDPASQRSGSKMRGENLSCVSVCFLSASTIMILLPDAQAPAPWGEGFVMCFGMFLFSLHHTDPASGRSGSKMRGKTICHVFRCVSLQPPP